MPLTAEQRSMRARLGGLVCAALHDPRKTTLPARQKFIKSFLDQVDPALPMAERLVRAERLRSAFYTKMALASSIARSKKAAARKTTDKVEGHQPEAVALDAEEVTHDDNLN